MRGVVNGLLTEVSRAVATPGMILLAATNDISVVDPAVVRPGRFDLKIPIRNPDQSGVANILLSLLGKANFDEADLDDLFGVSRQLVGCSGAQTAAIARQALGLARVAGRSVTVADVRKAAGAMLTEDSDNTYRKAVHEAGHAVARIHSILPNPIRIQLAQGGALVETPMPAFFTEETAKAELCVLLAGRAAELVCLGAASSGSGEGPQSDIAVATNLALKLEVEWGLGEELRPWSPSSVLLSVGIPHDVKSKVTKRLQQAEKEALNVISKHEQQVRSLAKELVEVREMSADNILQVIQGTTDHRSIL